jgi:hypothetical protein
MLEVPLVTHLDTTAELGVEETRATNLTAEITHLGGASASHVG